MYFAEFYTYSDYSKKNVPACGDRATLILDGRNNIHTHNTICIDWAKKHNFIGYTINKGTNILRDVKTIQTYRSV
jgi:hypothetical protein